MYDKIAAVDAARAYKGASRQDLNRLLVALVVVVRDLVVLLDCHAPRVRGATDRSTLTNSRHPRVASTATATLTSHWTGRLPRFKGSRRSGAGFGFGRGGVAAPMQAQCLDADAAQ